MAFNNIALICIIAMASFLKSGSISIFNFSFNLQSVPLNIIGISYAVAAFPTLAKSFSSGKKEEFKKHLKESGSGNSLLVSSGNISFYCAAGANCASDSRFRIFFLG
jgi:peptidoglycan biosynthesis protein MviN/MurJ (putative lipid II flippase)